MAVLNAQYTHPQSAYSQGLKNLIDSMLKVNPAERPDINQVLSFIIIIRQITERAVVGDCNGRQGHSKFVLGSMVSAFVAYYADIFIVHLDFISLYFGYC